VQKKQAQALGLRAKLVIEREERSAAVAALNAAPYGSNHLRAQPAEKAAFMAHVRLNEAHVACEQRIAETEKQLRTAEQAPPPVVQPLPSEEPSALAVLSSCTCRRRCARWPSSASARRARCCRGR
jgi:hypothetical protein